MRLGAYPAVLDEGSLVADIYGATQVTERHRHRYEVNNSYRDVLEKAGLRLSGMSPDRNLVEFVELDRALHPFFVATQAHPEFKSRPTRPHPLFYSFVAASLDYLKGERLPIGRRRRVPAAPAASGARVARDRRRSAGSDTAPGLFDVVAGEAVFAGKIVRSASTRS